MDLVKWEPFAELDRIQSRINELFSETFGRSRLPSTVPAAAWYPPVDILESNDAYLLRAELPGMKKEDIQLEYHEGCLTLGGEKRMETPAEGVEYQRAERASGKFYRSFYLPQSVKQAEIKASYRDGILEVTVPKTDEAKPKQIEVTVH